MRLLLAPSNQDYSLYLCAMFYLLDLTREMDIPPRYFGRHLKEEISRRLKQEVEGACNGQHGFVLAVIAVLSTGKGLIREGVGSAVFTVGYRCITFMPHKDEVLDAIVKSVNKVSEASGGGSLFACSLPLLPCVLGQCGHSVSRHHDLPCTLALIFVLAVALQMGFFAEAGPLTVFVSNHLIPDDFEFDSTHEPCYANVDGDQKVVAGSEVRLRIVGTRVDANEIVSVRTGAASGGRCVSCCVTNASPRCVAVCRGLRRCRLYWRARVGNTPTPLYRV